MSETKTVDVFLRIGNSVIKVDDTLKLPPNRIFRDAWVVNGNVISVDMEKAKQIQKDRLAPLRRQKMIDLEIEMLQAEDEGRAADADAARAKRVKLSKLEKAPLIENAPTLDALRSVDLDDVMR